MQQISIRKNYIYSMAYQVLTLVTPLITAPYVARVLGADGNGIYSYTTSIMAYFTLFAALGTASYGSREIAQHRDDKKAYSKLFWEIEFLTVFTSLICLAVWIGFIFISSDYKYYYIALTPLLLGTMFDISWFYTGHEQMKYIVIRNSLCKIAGIVLLFLLVRESDDLILYMWINSVVLLVGSLSMWTYLPKFVERPDLKSLTFRRHLKETMIYFIPTIATSIYTVLDKTLIGVLTHNEYENGYYEQATKVINIVKALVFTSVNTIMGARTSYLFAEKKYDEIHQRVEKSMDFILMMGMGCTFGIIGIAKTFVPWFFGDGYDPVVPLLYIFAPIIIIIGISNCLGSLYYTPGGYRARSAVYIIIGSAVNLCLNLLLIPKLGGTGAAVASIIAELTITVLYVKMCDGYMTVRILWSQIWKRLIAGAVMCVLIYVIGEQLHITALFEVCAQIIAGILIYLLLLRAFRDDMVRFLIHEVTGRLRRRG